MISQFKIKMMTHRISTRFICFSLWRTHTRNNEPPAPTERICQLKNRGKSRGKRSHTMLRWLLLHLSVFATVLSGFPGDFLRPSSTQTTREERREKWGKGHSRDTTCRNHKCGRKSESYFITVYQCTMFLKDDCFWANDEYVETYMQITTVAYTMEAPNKSPWKVIICRLIGSNQIDTKSWFTIFLKCWLSIFDPACSLCVACYIVGEYWVQKGWILHCVHFFLISVCFFGERKLQGTLCTSRMEATRKELILF